MTLLRTSSIIAATLVGLASPALADVNLEFRAHETCIVGGTLDVELVAVSDSAETQTLSAIDLVFTWDAAKLDLLGLDHTGGVLFTFSGFSVVLHGGLNEAVPPQDGDGMYRLFGPLGVALPATPEGTLITTFQFEAVSSSPGTTIDMVASGGEPLVISVVYDGVVPGLAVTGTLAGATVEIVCDGDCDECTADIDGTGVVAFTDLLEVLSSWGPCVGCPADLDDDGVVAFADLLAVLSAWGPCP